MDEYEIRQKSLQKKAWLNMLAEAHRQATEDMLEEGIASFEAHENNQGYSSMV
jgi:hypothetical protein